MHKLTTFGDHRNRALSVCCNFATVLSVRKGFFMCVCVCWGAPVRVCGGGGGVIDGVHLLVCLMPGRKHLPYIFGFPFASADMRSGLHCAEPSYHSSHNLFTCNDGVLAMSSLI